MLMQYNAFLLDIEKYDFVISNMLKEMLFNGIKITLSMFYSYIFKDFYELNIFSPI